MTRRSPRRLDARTLVALIVVCACAEAAPATAPVDPPSPAPPTTPSPPPPPPPPSPAGAERIFLADSSGRVIGILVAGARPAWSPDGRRLAYQRDGKIRLVDLDGDNDVAIADGGTPAWSPDGSRLAIANATGIVVIDTRGAIERVVVRHDFRTDTYREWDMGVAKPSWSADGTIIAFEHLGDGDMTPAQVFLVPAVGGTPRLFSDNGRRIWYAESDPAFSPDGTWIAFWSYGFGLAVARAEDGRPVVLNGDFPTIAYGANPDWSPDGRRLAITIWRGRSRSVAVIDAAGGAFREIIPNAQDAVWSPDGRRFAFVSTRPD